MFGMHVPSGGPARAGCEGGAVAVVIMLAVLGSLLAFIAYVFMNYL